MGQAQGSQSGYLFLTSLLGYVVGEEALVGEVDNFTDNFLKSVCKRSDPNEVSFVRLGWIVCFIVNVKINVINHGMEN